MREQRKKEKIRKIAKQKPASTEENNTPAANNNPASAFTDPKNRAWPIIAAAMAITVLLAQAVQGPQSSSSVISIYSAMLWSGIFGATLCRYTGKNGWIGFALGSAVGAILSTLIGVF